MLLRRRVDVRPGPGAVRPDVRGDPHVAGIVQGARAHHHHAGIGFALAVDGRAAVAAEKPEQGAAAVRAGGVALGRSLRDAERVARQDGIDAAAGARALLAMGAVACAQLGDGGGEGISDGAAEAAAGQRLRHSKSIKWSRPAYRVVSPRATWGVSSR